MSFDLDRPRVLLVDREVHWRAQVAATFQAEQLDVIEVDNATRAVEALAQLHRSGLGPFHLAIVDVSPIDPDDRVVFGTLRSRGIPFIVVSARRDEHSVLSGYSLGADAFIAKPVGLPELIARARAVMRRTPADRPDPRRPLVVGTLCLDQLAHEVRLDGRVVAMPRREFEILEMLLRDAGRIVPRQTLMRALWGASRDTKTLDVHVRNLRAKLEAGDGRRRIVTIRGVGFRFDTEAGEPAVSDATAS